MALPDVADTYRLRVVGLFGSVEWNNVFFYRDTAVGGPSPESVGSGFWTKVKAAWRAFLPTNTGLTVQRIEVEALFGDHEFFNYSIPVAEQQGTRALVGDFMPAFVAATVKLEVGTRATRPGSKRFVGLLENDVTQPQLVAGTLTIVQTLADLLDQTFTATSTAINLTPVVVGYPTPPPVSQPLRVQDVTNAIAQPYVSHQVSRDSRP